MMLIEMHQIFMTTGRYLSFSFVLSIILALVISFGSGSGFMHQPDVDPIRIQIWNTAEKTVSRNLPTQVFKHPILPHAPFRFWALIRIRI
jgi:hypothetical protein